MLTEQAHTNTFRPSRYQHAFLQDVVGGNGHTALIARAGTGKSRTILEAVASLPAGATVLVCAFNKSIRVAFEAALAERDVQADVTVRTLHQVGLAGCRARIDGDKGRRIARAVLGDAAKASAVSELTDLTGLAKGCLAASASDIAGVAERAKFALPEAREARAALLDDVLRAMSMAKADPGKVDFDDMIFLPVVHKCSLKTYSHVFVDEAQDLNASQVELILMSLRPDGRIFVVGDPHQAIYGFRGAAPEAMESMIDRLKAKTLWLPISYRCPRSVILLAQTVCPDIEAHENAIEGTVRSIPLSRLTKEARAGDLVVSRSNAPLVRQTFALLSAGIPAIMMGRDFGAKLHGFVEKAEANVVGDLLGYVDRWEAREIEKAERKGADPQVFIDQAECLRVFADAAESVDDVLAKIDRLFSDDVRTDDRRVVLSSTHKAKGGERDRVFLLRSTYLRKRKGAPSSSEELNLYYVAVTRAKRELVIVEGDQ